MKYRYEIEQPQAATPDEEIVVKWRLEQSEGEAIRLIATTPGGIAVELLSIFPGGDRAGDFISVFGCGEFTKTHIGSTNTIWIGGNWNVRQS